MLTGALSCGDGGARPAESTSAVAVEYTPESFTAEVERRLRLADPELTVERVGELRLRVESQDQGASLFLGNAWALYQEEPGEEPGEELIEGYVQSFLEMRAPAGREDIVPVIKDRAWLDETRLGVGEDGSEGGVEHLFEELNAELVVLYAYDLPTSIRYLKPGDLDSLDVVRDELRELACENLVARLPEVHIEPVDEHVWSVTADGYYDASLLLLDEVWNRPELALPGELVVALPARDMLFATGSDDELGVQGLRTAARRIAAEAPYRLTDVLFVRRDGRFVPFEDN